MDSIEQMGSKGGHEMKGKASTGEMKTKSGAVLRLAKPGEAPRPSREAKKMQSAKPSAAAMAVTEAAVEKSMRHTERIAPGNKLAYNVREAAEALGVSPWYVRDEMSLGRLGFSSARGRKIIPRWELVRYLEEYMQGSAEASGDEAETKPVSNPRVGSGNQTLQKTSSGRRSE